MLDTPFGSEYHLGMSVWNKILLGLICVISLGFFHAAARTVKTYQYWANKANDFEKRLKEVNAEIVSLRTADHKSPRADKTIGVQQLRIDLGRVLANRGRIWPRCEKQKAAVAPSGTMEVKVSTEESVPNDKMLLYVFEEGDDQLPGKYLGEFYVKAVGEKQVVLASTTQLVSSLSKHVTESKSPWVLYEMMPTDEHEAFANLTEDQKNWFANLPGDQKKWGLVDKSERPLRDYLEIFRTCEMHRTLFADRRESASRDLSYLEAASQEAKNQEALAEKEKTQVKKELDWAKAELTAVADLFASRQDRLKEFQMLVKDAIAKNHEYAQEIAKLQKDASDKIDSRMRSMAQFGSRAN